jgi:hypothetical protein
VGDSDAGTDPGRSGGAGEAEAPPEDWVVIVEASAQPAYQFPEVRELVARLAGRRATALYSLERYAVQLRVTAPTHHEALTIAVAAHHEAITAMGVAAPTLLRVEVMTLGEMKLGHAESSTGTAPARVYEALVPTAVYDATRALFQATTRAGIDRVLTGFVLAAGGSVNIGELSYFPGQVSVDLGLSPDDRVYATADADSVSGLIIEQSLPTLVVDAQRMLTRLRLVDRTPLH